MARADRRRGTTTFVVERYWPGVDEATLRAALPRLARAASAMTEEGCPVAHLGSLLMPGDQVVFSVFTAESGAHVAAVNDRAELPVDRITAAVALGFYAGTEVGQ